MLRRVALVRTDVSEEHSTSIIRVTGIGELETTLAVTSNRRTLRTSVLTRATLRNIPEDASLQERTDVLDAVCHKLIFFLGSFMDKQTNRLGPFIPNGTHTPTDRPQRSANFVSTLADKGRCLVSAACSTAANLGFLYRNRYFFHSNSS
jgi:hypothetical protein